MGDRSADHSGLAGGPAGSGPAVLGPAPTSDPKYVMRLVTYRRADGVLVTAMRPVPNPEDLSADDRRAIYGARYAPRAFLAAGHGRRNIEIAVQPASQMATSHPAIARPAPPRPVVVAKLPPPSVITTVPAPKMVELTKPAPAPTTAVAVLKTPPAPAPAPLGLKAPSDPKLAALQAAVGPEVATGSNLTVPDNLPVGQSGQVSLSLPQTLWASLQREAAKLGLGKAAKKADVTATLSGQGYEITPNGPQTAQLKTGEAPSFNWQVKPGPGEKGALKADVDATLKGLRLPQSFSLASLEEAVKAAMPVAPPVAKSSWMDVLSIPGLKDIEVPGLGRVPSKSVVGAVLVLLALLILVSMARNGGGRADRDERRRKFRTMTDYGSKPVEPAFDDESQPHYAAPLAAAAVAAAVVAAHEEHKAEAEHAAETPVAPAEAEAHATDVHDAPAAGPHAEPVVRHDLTAPIALSPTGAASEDDYGLSQVVREGRPAADAHLELERT